MRFELDKSGIEVKKVFFIILSVLFLSQFTFATDNADYRLVWQDTFEGSQLDEANNWQIEVNGDGGGNNELQYYRRENISVGEEPVSGENCLIITAKKESYNGKTCTSGRLISYGKMSFQYGKIEARIKLPKTANGLWPAFWMMGADYFQPGIGWPKCGEIDILEVGNVNGINRGTQDRYFSGWFHWGEAWTPQGYPNWGMDKTADYSIQDDFHLFTLIWNPDKLAMYLDLDRYPDTAPYVEMNINVSGGTGPGQVGRYFHKPFYVVFNLAIGGNFPQIWDINKITALNASNNYEAKMYVDYVKVYQKGDEGEQYDGPSLTGIKMPVKQSVFRTYFNQMTGCVEIEGDETPEKVILYNLSGEKIREVSGINLIDVLCFSKGVYILKIQAQSGKEEVHKLVKQ